MAKQKLEEIFWKEGKFVNRKGKEVRAEPIGKPIKTMQIYKGGGSSDARKHLIYDINQKLGDLIREDEKYFEVNSFLKGKEDRIENYSNFPIQFYEI